MISLQSSSYGLAVLVVLLAGAVLMAVLREQDCLPVDLISGILGLGTIAVFAAGFLLCQQLGGERGKAWTMQS
jgi:hypothetical protein